MQTSGGGGISVTAAAVPFFILLFKTGSNYVAKASLEFIMYLRVALNTQSSSQSLDGSLISRHVPLWLSFIAQLFCPVITL